MDLDGLLQVAATKTDKPINVFDYILSPSRTAPYLSLRRPDGDTQESHAERRPVCLRLLINDFKLNYSDDVFSRQLAFEAIELINLQYGQLENDHLIFPVTKGNYRGKWRNLSPLINCSRLHAPRSYYYLW